MNQVLILIVQLLFAIGVYAALVYVGKYIVKNVDFKSLKKSRFFNIFPISYIIGMRKTSSKHHRYL